MALRSIVPMQLPDVERAEITAGERPRFEWVEPGALYVDEAYQRNLSDRSVRLIRKIVSGWDWTAFKPPIVVDVAGKWHVVDGQHTAIAAISHGAIKKIPVMIVAAPDAQDRAGAFVKHNRDRIEVTPTQLFFALVQAGDENALTIKQVCDRAGATVLRNPPFNGKWKAGDTVAVKALQGLVNRRHAQGARRVLEICVKGDIAPVSAGYLKAVEEILFGKEYKGVVDDETLGLTIREMNIQIDKESSRFAAEHDLPIWRAMVVTLFRHAKKVRRGSAKAA